MFGRATYLSQLPLDFLSHWVWIKPYRHTYSSNCLMFRRFYHLLTKRTVCKSLDCGKTSGNWRPICPTNQFVLASASRNKSLSKAKSLSHVDTSGKVNMVDVGEKPISRRVARASGTISLGEAAFRLLKENKLKKGDVLTVADVAGIMAAKETSRLIPLCHSIPLSKVNLTFQLDETKYSVRVTSEVKTVSQTGVEMEALMAVSVSLLAVYDMCKAVNKAMVITDIKLLMKTGGKTDYTGSQPQQQQEEV